MGLNIVQETQILQQALSSTQTLMGTQNGAVITVDVLGNLT